MRKPANGTSSAESSAQPDAASAKRAADSTRSATFMGAVSAAADERIQWRRPDRDRRKGWSFRKLRNQPALPSPDGGEVSSPEKTDTAVSTLAEETRAPSPTTSGTEAVDYPGGQTSEPAEADDDYAVLAHDDDINWSAGYVKLCCMPEGTSQDCSSFQDLRKVQHETPSALAQRQAVGDGLQNVKHCVNTGDGAFLFGSPTDLVCDGRTTLSCAEQQSACGVRKQPTKSAMMTEWEEVLLDTDHGTTDLHGTAHYSRPEWFTEGAQFAVVADRSTGAIPKRPKQMTSLPVSENQSSRNQQPSVQSSTSSGRLADELTQAGPSGYTTCAEKCPVGVLIQPHQAQQQQQQCAASDVANAPDSLFGNGSYFRSLQRSPLVDFPPPHPPASDQMFWAADRGSLENYAATGESCSNTWPVAGNCSRSVVSSDDSVFAYEAGAASYQRDMVASSDSFAESTTAGIFMFSDDDDDNLCGSIGSDCSGPLRASNNLFKARSMDRTAQREDGSGDGSLRDRVVELVVNT